jgi:hypothetical protein
VPIHNYFLNETEYACRAHFDFSEDRGAMHRCSQIVKTGRQHTQVLLKNQKQRRMSMYISFVLILEDLCTGRILYKQTSNLT